VRERIQYRFRVPSAADFTLYSYSKALEYHFKVPTARSLRPSRRRDLVIATYRPYSNRKTTYKDEVASRRRLGLSDYFSLKFKTILVV
jgi:hypothetical protein